MDANVTSTTKTTKVKHALYKLPEKQQKDKQVSTVGKQVLLPEGSNSLNSVTAGERKPSPLKGEKTSTSLGLFRGMSLFKKSSKKEEDKTSDSKTVFAEQSSTGSQQIVTASSKTRRVPINTLSTIPLGGTNISTVDSPRSIHEEEIIETDEVERNSVERDSFDVSKLPPPPPVPRTGALTSSNPELSDQETLTQAIQDKNLEISTLQDQVDLLTPENEELKLQIRQLTLTVSQKDQEIEKLGELVGKDNAQTIKDLQSEIAILKSQKSVHSGTVDELEKTKKDLIAAKNSEFRNLMLFISASVLAGAIGTYNMMHTYGDEK